MDDIPTTYAIRLLQNVMLRGCLKESREPQLIYLKLYLVPVSRYIPIKDRLC